MKTQKFMEKEEVEVSELGMKRHTLAHLLAAAVERLYPEALIWQYQREFVAHLL